MLHNVLRRCTYFKLLEVEDKLRARTWRQSLKILVLKTTINYEGHLKTPTTTSTNQVGSSFGKGKPVPSLTAESLFPGRGWGPGSSAEISRAKRKRTGDEERKKKGEQTGPSMMHDPKTCSNFKLHHVGKQHVEIEAAIVRFYTRWWEKKKKLMCWIRILHLVKGKKNKVKTRPRHKLKEGI